MKRRIITISDSLCNGCGLCVNACHEGALQLIDGKVKLISESYCDGLGDCLPECPTGAITLEERETAEYDEEAVKENLNRNKSKNDFETSSFSCPGSQTKFFEKKQLEVKTISSPEEIQSQLAQWPCQLKLVSVDAPYFESADLLIAADCTAFAYANVHNEFMRDKITLIACPKLDEIDYSEKLTAIIKKHSIIKITVLKMEVPCCGGLVNAVKKAIANSGKIIPLDVVTISTRGNII
jgi:ferredoxin